MTDKQKIQFQQQLIERLEKENSEPVRKLVRELQSTIAKYKVLTDQTIKLNKEYQSHIKELKTIKARYQKDLAKFVKELK